MVKVLEINGLNYHDFKNINLSFRNNSFYSIIGGNNSGKTTLFHLIMGLIPTDNIITCDNVLLNSDSIYEYIKKIGIVERVNENSFIYESVYNEMSYPLYNLGYSKIKRDNRIKKVLNYFNAIDFLNKKINELSYYEKQKLLIMLSILHKPKVLLLDSVLNVFSKDDRKEVVSILKEIIINEKMTVISFVPDLVDFIDSDYLILLSKYNIVGEYVSSDIYDNDQKFYQEGLEIPFVADLTNKLKMYDLVKDNYTSMEEMVNDIWP